MKDWYTVGNIASVDSPSLLIYVDRVRENIQALIQSTEKPENLRPHIKTHKSPQVSAMMIAAGIKKFKCATISEAEMLAAAGASDVLLAYQPVGPKVARLSELTDEYQQTKFSCLVDNIGTASFISSEFANQGKAINVYIDLNVGMNRTGIVVEKALELFENIRTLRGINIMGVHAYDGHIRDADYATRKKKCDDAFAPVKKVADDMSAASGNKMTIIAGGTPTYSIHCKRPDVECSPGTFIYWDMGYSQILKEQKFQFAALVVSRVISKPAPNTICLDLGHKAIASENPLDQRVYFLNAPDIQAVGHSEEHMVFRTEKSYDIGDVLYGVPHHICPTVALHDQAAVVENGVVKEYWSNISRNRKITI